METKTGTILFMAGIFLLLAAVIILIADVIARKRSLKRMRSMIPVSYTHLTLPTIVGV